ncbi:ionotropic receptor 75a-like [Malaya genurostris]|uniref:ionotropic receptor 75a-like n=1 Tax=Malaya genurostris TaxID=325434 RepID=UPI0026F37F4C|nr:ionotropic receptor 75a-like [Malaya genurostris]XP_058463501.1 ionotropic receptor 75a-like [Malaya genurostris]XP_058463502.1 ionotropic receptor 75a-like [Malaya genurostris]
MKAEVTVLLVMCFCTITTAFDPTVPEVLRGLLKTIRHPLQLSIVGCWEESTRKQFFGVFKESYLTLYTDDHISQLPEDINRHQIFMVVDLSCPNSIELLESVGKWLYIKYRWLILWSAFLNDDPPDEDTQMQFYVQSLADLPVLVSSEVFLFIKRGTDHFLINQIYKTGVSSSLVVELFGTWINGSLIDERNLAVTSTRRLNLRGHTLRASMVVTNPETLHHLTDYKDKHIDTITKVNHVLTNHLIEYLGAHVNYSVVSSWGYYNTSTKRWDGMIGELSHRTADLGASPLFFTVDRIAVIEYIAMTSATRSKFIFRSPKLSYTENVFLLPFDDIVWLCIGAVVLLASGLLLITAMAETHLSSVRKHSRDPSILQPTFRDTLLMIYGATCQQGSSSLPRSFSARTITLIAFTVLMFLYGCYSANIVALLQSPSTKIRTLEDLLASRLKFGVHDTVFNRHYFSHATESTRQAIYERKIRQPSGSENFVTLEQGIDQIRRGLYAFHVEQGVGYKVISETYQEDEKCGLQEIQYLQVIDPYYAIQKDSAYKEHVKIGLFRLNEHGIQYRENSNLYTKKPKCTGGGGRFVPVSLVDTEPAILVIVWGAGLSAVIFVAEMIFVKIMNRYHDWRPFRPVSQLAYVN